MASLSAADKRTKLLELFHESSDNEELLSYSCGTFHKLQELEKSAPKLKGIGNDALESQDEDPEFYHCTIFDRQSVKDVLQSLVDDGLVTVEKIGTSNYYWSFPSAVQQSKKGKLQVLRDEFQRLEKANAELEANIQRALNGREDNDQRQELMAKLLEAEAEDRALQQELQKYSDSDPTLLEGQKKYSKIAKDAANRWTGKFDHEK
ncbi:Meiotic nuclear division protein 1 [Mortierella sp. AM989]|nr:Meiotic nuclear division protein 1 [Mortierella sp. AM989]